MNSKHADEETPLVTAVIATFNSMRVLPQTLDALCAQNYPMQKLQILLVDGGSTDGTRDLSQKYPCEIIDNPQTEPVYAKLLGYNKAKGKYIIFLDHDEVLVNPHSLYLKVKAFEADSNIKAALVSGYRNPPGCAAINNYINEFGDPFSFFIYHLSKGEKHFCNSMKNRYTPKTVSNDFMTYNLSKEEKLPIIELVAAGSMIDREYFQKTFPETITQKELIPHFFYLMNSDNKDFAIIHDDQILHYSSDTLMAYFRKIKWRVKNNIYHTQMGQSGFSGRNKFQPKWLRLKPFFFPLYAFIPVLLLLDTLYLTFSRGSLLYLLHTPLTIYTAGLIVFHKTRKALGYQDSLTSYDGKKVIKTRNKGN